MTRLICTLGIAAFSLCSLAQAGPPEAQLPDKHRAFFKAHCLDCHDSETREGKVDLETLPFRITTHRAGGTLAEGPQRVERGRNAAGGFRTAWQR